MNSESSEKRINRWNIYSFVTLSIVNFTVFSIAFKFFDKSAVGYYLLLTSVFLLGGNLDLGFGVATIKLISSAKSRNDFTYINEYFTTYLAAYIAMMLFILILQYLYSFFSRAVFDFNEIGGIKVLHVYIFVALNFVFTFLSNYLRCFLEGLYEFIFISKVTIVMNIFLMLISFGVILINKNFLIFISVNFIISFLIFTYFLLRILNHYKIKIKPENFNFKILKENFNYNFKLQTSFLIGNSLDYIIKFLISSMISIGFVTTYEAGKKIITFINGFIYSYQKILFVKISEFKTYKNETALLNNEIFSYSLKSLKMSVIFFGVFNPIICVFLYFWFKDMESIKVFLLLSLPFSLISFLISFYNVLIVEGRNHYLITIQAINVILISGLTYMGFLLFGSFVGLIGYYAATIISMFMIFNYFKKFHSFDVVKYLKEVKIYKAIILNSIIFIQLFVLSLNYSLINIAILFQIIFVLFFFKEIQYFILNFREVYFKKII